MGANPYTCTLEGDNTVRIRSADCYLDISLKRTIRVPDNADISRLPPDLGEFSLYPVPPYANKLPDRMLAKGGLFFPMYQREAMWINFTATDCFAVKIYVGGVNAVSGEPYIEDADTQRRRLKLLSEGKSIQDYVVAPDQEWLDGIVSGDGQVRQFVVNSLGSSFTVEGQMTGAEVFGGLQFEVTPRKRKRILPVYVKHLTGESIRFLMDEGSRVEELKDKIMAYTGIPAAHQRLIFGGGQLDNGPRTLREMGIKQESTVQLVLRLKGGGQPVVYDSDEEDEMEMGIAAGGLVEQIIVPDNATSGYWDTDNTVTFNIQIMNSDSFKHVTGLEAPPTLIDAKTYAAAGLPFFSLDEETTGIAGLFQGVKSVGELLGSEEASVDCPVEHLGKRGVDEDEDEDEEWCGEDDEEEGEGEEDDDDADDEVDMDEDEDAGEIIEIRNSNEALVNPVGPLRVFRTVEDLRSQLIAATRAGS